MFLTCPALKNLFLPSCVTATAMQFKPLSTPKDFAVFHKPHPQKETDKATLKSVRRFFTETGSEPKRRLQKSRGLVLTAL